MLYLIGGASRSGKTLLARRAVAERQIPYFPIDGLLSVFAERIPILGVTYEQSLVERPVKMWPMTKQLLTYLIQEEQDYVVEGDSFLPSQIHEFMHEQQSVRCCFLGYTELTEDEKLIMVRQYHQGNRDWTKEIPDTDMLKMINEMIQFSEYLKNNCAAQGIEYFDVSRDFQEARDAAYNYLFSPPSVWTAR